MIPGLAIAGDSNTSLSLGAILVFDRDMLHNARPFETTNETTISIELLFVKGTVKSVHFAQDDRFTSNVQSFYQPPLGTYDGQTTFTFTLTPGDGKKTIWAILQGKNDISFPPTSATLTLDTTPPHFSLIFTKQSKGDILVDVTFSEPVHGFDADDVDVGGSGGRISKFSGEGDKYQFTLHPKDRRNVKIKIDTDNVWDTAGNQVNMAPVVETISLPDLRIQNATESNFFDNGNLDLLLFDSSNVWVNFDYSGVEAGTETNPFNTLAEGLAAVTYGGTIHVVGSSTNEHCRIIQNVRIEASGGVGRFGQATSQPARITQQPIQQNLPIGSQAIINVQATGSGIISYQWKKDGEAIVDDSRITGAQTASLHIDNLEQGDAGLYSCYVSNEFGDEESATAQLTVLIPPVASFTYSYASQLTVNFDGSASTDPDKDTITSYEWDFGDNSTHGTGLTTSHAYSAPGVYTITLTVHDCDGLTGSVSHSFYIGVVELRASDGHVNDFFGFSVDIDGDTAVSGAYRYASQTGAIYVYTKNGSQWQEQLIKGSDLSCPLGDRFGYAVAINGDTIVVGVPCRDLSAGSDVGSAYILTNSSGVWSQTAWIRDLFGGTAYDSFGSSVGIDGDISIYGAPGFNNNQGAAYLFTRLGQTGPVVPDQKLTLSGGASGDQFGYSVAISGQTAIVGAPGMDYGGQYNSGAAYIYVWNGSSWEMQGSALPATMPIADAGFGYSVAIDGDRAVIGAPGSGNGSAYVFTRSGSSWSLQSTLTASDGASGDWFGRSVDIKAGTIIVGASQARTGGVAAGAAYLFSLIGGSWVQQERWTSQAPQTDEAFGQSVAVESNPAGTDLTSIVGAYMNDTGGMTNVGAANLFFVNRSAKIPLGRKYKSKQLQSRQGVCSLEVGRNVNDFRSIRGIVPRQWQRPRQCDSQSGPQRRAGRRPRRTG